MVVPQGEMLYVEIDATHDTRSRTPIRWIRLNPVPQLDKYCAELMEGKLSGLPVAVLPLHGGLELSFDGMQNRTGFAFTGSSFSVKRMALYLPPMLSAAAQWRGGVQQGSLPLFILPVLHPTVELIVFGPSFYSGVKLKAGPMVRLDWLTQL